MARRSTATVAAQDAAVVDDQVEDSSPGEDLAAPSAPEPEAPAGEFDVEAWVADVYDHQHNGGPKPVRKYRPPLPTPVG